VSREPDPYRDDDDETQEYAPQSIFAAGWFRAVLVLTVLAIVVVVSLPYLLNWFEPIPPSGSPQPTAGVGAPTPASPPAQPPVAAPATPPPVAAKAESDKPPAPSGPPVAAKPESLPERPSAPAKPQATPEKAPAPSRPAAGPRETTPRQEAKAGTAARSMPGGAPTAASAKREYWVQLGLFKDAKNAEAIAKAVREDGFTVEVDRVTRTADGERGTYHVVRAGKFADLAAATKARNALRAKGHQGFIAAAGAS
jgi:cell division septation protein DedD